MTTDKPDINICPHCGADLFESMGETDEAFIRDIMDKTLESWIEMVDKSETPWALCDDCYKAVEIFILKGRT